MAKKKNKLNKSNSSGWLDNYSEEFSVNTYPEGGKVESEQSALSKLKKALSLKENLGNLNTEQGYDTPLNQILRTAVGAEGIDYSNQPMSSIAREQDAFRMYLGLPSKTGAFEQTGPNKYRIRDYAQLYPDTLPSDEAIAYSGRTGEDIAKDTSTLDLKKIVELQPYADILMGNHRVTKGKDAKGEYLRYYDRFDLDPTRYANQFIDRNVNPNIGKYLKKATPVLDKLENIIFNPFELEDKVYYDPKTKLRSDIILQQNKQRVVPGQPVAIPAEFPGGGRVNPIYVSDRNDPRLRSYNDSLDLYNKSMRAYPDYVRRFNSDLNKNNRSLLNAKREAHIFKEPISQKDKQSIMLRRLEDAKDEERKITPKEKILPVYNINFRGRLSNPALRLLEEKANSGKATNYGREDRISTNDLFHGSQNYNQLEMYQKPNIQVIYDPSKLNKNLVNTPILKNKLNNTVKNNIENNYNPLLQQIDSIKTALFKENLSPITKPILYTQAPLKLQQPIPLKEGTYLTREQQGQETGGTRYTDKKTGKLIGTMDNGEFNYNPLWLEMNPGIENKQNGGDIGNTLETNPYYKEANQFLLDYYNSPRYKEMISESAPENANYFTENRIANLTNIPPLNLPKIDRGNQGGFSDSKTGEITIYPSNQTSTSTYLHELTHNSDRPITAQDLKKDIRLIPDYDKQLVEKLLYPNLQSKLSKESWNKYTDSEKKEREKFYSNKIKNYVGTPEEVRARLLEIRKTAKDNNVYNPFTEKVGYNEIQKLLYKEFDRLEKDDKGNYPLLDLLEGFDSDGVIQMLNEISQNKDENNLPMAKNGGKINNNMKKKLKKYPAGGYLDYQDAYKGFGVGPTLTQDNSYYRSIMPSKIEDIQAEINQPSALAGLNNVLGGIDQIASQGIGLVGNFMQSKMSGAMGDMGDMGGEMGNFFGTQKGQNFLTKDYSNFTPSMSPDLGTAGTLNNPFGGFGQGSAFSPNFSLMGGQGGASALSSQADISAQLPEAWKGVPFLRNGGYLNRYQEGGMTEMPVGYPEYIHKSNVFQPHVIPVPKVHFYDDTSVYDMGVNLNDLVQMNGGGIGKYANGGDMSLQGYFNYLQNQSQNKVPSNAFNSNTQRANADQLAAAQEGDFMHTKLRNDRQQYQDNKVDWGFMNWAKEPAGAGLGLLSSVPVLGDTVKNVAGDSFLTRTSGYQVGQGVGKGSLGVAKLVAGVPKGDVSMILGGVGDIGEGVGGAVGNLNAKSAMGDYNKSGYVSGKRLANAATDFNTTMGLSGKLYGMGKSIVDLANDPSAENLQTFLNNKNPYNRANKGQNDLNFLLGQIMPGLSGGGAGGGEMAMGGYLNNYQEGGMVFLPEDLEIPKYKKGGLTPTKARQMLHDKSYSTDKQRKYFGYISSQKKSSGGWIDSL